MVFEILKNFEILLEEKKTCKLLFIWMQARHNEKLKELVYPPPNIVRW